LAPLEAAAPGERGWLRLFGARLHNLRGIDVRLPLGALTVVTGVSGSGKSSLVHGVLRPALEAALASRRGRGEREASSPAWDRLEGQQRIDRVREVDASPIGRTPRSVPATYLKIMDELRTLFAATPEARARGFGPSRFSFNTAGGRCESCKGQGRIRIDMAFLPDVDEPCPVCEGRRYSPETLEVRLKGRTIAEVLEATVAEACEWLGGFERLRAPLELLRDTGLGYLQLGQPSPTLSGGEAQRLKLAAELGRSSRRRTLYVLDEPTTGLHASDTARLLAAFERLLARGDTLVVVEHDLEVIARANWVIDLGPGAGAAGGRVLFEGEPARLAEADTPTGRALARWLAHGDAAPTRVAASHPAAVGSP
ncbi:MAG: excinuclease ABC subunit A, partial [Planctomycetota bacterium]